MPDPEKRLLAILKDCGVDILCTCPCDRIKGLLAMASKSTDFLHLPLTREEEGVGICAGAALAGKRPAMLIQNSGLGNMVNALLSLTKFYELPLAIFLSHRGVYKEGIPAQVPMGNALEGLLDTMDIRYSSIEDMAGLETVPETLSETYRLGRVHVFLLSPALWEGSGASALINPEPEAPCTCSTIEAPARSVEAREPVLSRYEILHAMKDELRGNAVICNLGVPAKELHEILPQNSNFYMLGSMGMAAPIGLGVALFTDERVIVVDGDGSILMNPGTLATIAMAGPDNLTIVAIDNASYGSTGCQPTLTGVCVDLEAVARGFGIKDTFKASGEQEILKAAKSTGKGPVFVHALGLPGNSSAPNIPIDRLEIKDRFRDFLKKD